MLPWKWFYTGTGKSTFTNWGTGEPGVGKCVTVSALGFWSTRECSEGKHFICYSGDAGRYILVQDSRSFHGARSYCRDRYTDLSTVNSVVNNTEIVTLLASHMYDSYSVNGNRWPIPSFSLAWIGLSNSWEWSDGSDVQLLPLTLQSGDGDCVMVREKLAEQGIREEVKLRWRTQPDGKVFHREEETAGYCSESSELLGISLYNFARNNVSQVSH
ncbi:uncharacterized protein LOC120733058 [Simochromis diagramma]|uniref:uncharacterized protein LOC120733058 n=1 Tax=Simochromis diagramma TaxID=43689 RepID=UPI001A7E736D|nr:uncharacterized protein LOC120733058 [Simochromis diagramma]